MPDFSLYSRNRGELLSFINTGVSVRVSPTNQHQLLQCLAVPDSLL